MIKTLYIVPQTVHLNSHMVIVGFVCVDLKNNSGLVLAGAMCVILTVLWWQPGLLQLLGLSWLPSRTTVHAVHGAWIWWTVSRLWVRLVAFLNYTLYEYVCVISPLWLSVGRAFLPVRN